MMTDKTIQIGEPIIVGTGKYSGKYAVQYVTYPGISGCVCELRSIIVTAAHPNGVQSTYPCAKGSANTREDALSLAVQAAEQSLDGTRKAVMAVKNPDGTRRKIPSRKMTIDEENQAEVDAMTDEEIENFSDYEDESWGPIGERRRDLDVRRFQRENPHG